MRWGTLAREKRVRSECTAGHPLVGRCYSSDIAGMFLRRKIKQPHGISCSYWHLCETIAGNRADVTTVEEIVTVMEAKYGAAKRVWVMDRNNGQRDEHRVFAETPRALLRGHAGALAAPP